jgi:hypothetical protein
VVWQRVEEQGIRVEKDIKGFNNLHKALDKAWDKAWVKHWIKHGIIRERQFP